MFSQEWGKGRFYIHKIGEGNVPVEAKRSNIATRKGN